MDIDRSLQKECTFHSPNLQEWTWIDYSEFSNRCNGPSLSIPLGLDMDRSLQKECNLHSPYIQEWTWTDHSKLLLYGCNGPSLSIHFNFGDNTHTKVDTDGTDTLTEVRNFISALTEWTWTDSEGHYKVSNFL